MEEQCSHWVQTFTHIHSEECHLFLLSLSQKYKHKQDINIRLINSTVYFFSPSMVDSCYLLLNTFLEWHYLLSEANSNLSE